MDHALKTNTMNAYQSSTVIMKKKTHTFASIENVLVYALKMSIAYQANVICFIARNRLMDALIYKLFKNREKKILLYFYRSFERL